MPTIDSRETLFRLIARNPETMSAKHDNPEARLILQIIKYIISKGGWAKKIKTKGSFTKQGSFIFDKYAAKGVPDILYFYNGTMGWIEAKATGTQSSEQKQFQELCISANIPYLLTHSLEDVEKIIK